MSHVRISLVLDKTADPGARRAGPGGDPSGLGLGYTATAAGGNGGGGGDGSAPPSAASLCLMRGQMYREKVLMRVGTSRENKAVSPPASRQRPGTAPGHGSRGNKGSRPGSAAPPPSALCRGRPSSAAGRQGGGYGNPAGPGMYPGQVEHELPTLTESTSGFGSQLVLPSSPDRTGAAPLLPGSRRASRSGGRAVAAASGFDAAPAVHWGSGDAGSAAEYGSALARSALRSGSGGSAMYEGSAVYGGYGGGMGGSGLGLEGAAPLGAGAPLFEGSTILERETVGKYAVGKGASNPTPNPNPNYPQLTLTNPNQVGKGAPVRDTRTLTPVRNQVAEGDLKNILMGETPFSGGMATLT